ncbi:hypothetical protein NP233_g4784 [Leucocoprinus birnbaumii]|uniref:Uncharacterized protein n=1 Tax=Leucocoprinus birnbaumii TaxID=56174 RepID=A0AAD5VUJ1_9AGAR|nr:hypothetical protein NP233_g4784 [Leucocoprinus birnbaumii]
MLSSIPLRPPPPTVRDPSMPGTHLNAGARLILVFSVLPRTLMLNMHALGTGLCSARTLPHNRSLVANPPCLADFQCRVANPFCPTRAPPNHYLDMRRASMDPRTLMPSRTDGLSPSLSSRPLHAIRSSLPDTSLFTSSRRYVSQIPGPLPEPGFTFGNATVSSPTDDEPPSPNLSSYSFPPREDATEDDDVMSSISFETLSRFGSAVSVATSESSVFSNPAFYDIGDLAPNQDSRGSCGSAQLASCVTANLDGTMQPPMQSPAPVTNDGYFDESTILTAGVNHDSQSQVDGISPPSSFTSPASTASPDGGSATQSSTPPANGPVSNTHELASAFAHGSQKLSLANDNFGGDLDLLEQQQQLHSGSSSHVPTPPPNQQRADSGHQTQAVDNDHSFGFDGCSSTRIDVASESSASIALPALPGQGIRGTVNNQQSKNPLLSDEANQSRGEFAASYSHLMEGFDFGTAFAMFDSGSTLEQRSGETCDPLVNIGLGAGVNDYTTSGVVTSASYGAAAGIAPNQPPFAS